MRAAVIPYRVDELVARFLDFEDPAYAHLEDVYAARRPDLAHANPTGSIGRAFVDLLDEGARGDVEGFERALDVSGALSDAARITLATMVLDHWGSTPRAIARSANPLSRWSAAASSGLDPGDAAWLVRRYTGARGVSPRSGLVATLGLNPAAPRRLLRQAWRWARRGDPFFVNDVGRALNDELARQRDGQLAGVDVASQWLVGSAYDHRRGEDTGPEVDGAHFVRLRERHGWLIERALRRAGDPGGRGDGGGELLEAAHQRLGPHLGPYSYTLSDVTARGGLTVEGFFEAVADGRIGEVVAGGRQLALRSARARAIADELGADPAVHQILLSLSETWTGSDDDLLETVSSVRR